MAQSQKLDSMMLTLSSQIFDPKNRFTEGRILSDSDGLISSLTVFTWPKATFTNEDKLAFLCYMTPFGRSDDESPTKWACWTYSFINLCFPNMQKHITREGNREYVFEALPENLVRNVVALQNEALTNEEESVSEGYKHILQELVFPSKFPSLERTLENFPDQLAACATIPSVYGYCSLLIFLSGKKINERNVSSISERRPQNIIDSYSISESASYFLTGDGKMGMTAHKFVNQTWSTYVPARIAIVSEVATFGMGTTLPQRVVYTVTQMLANVGMQPAYYIHRFLLAFPQCAEYACVRPALGVYMASVREVAQADALIQPYYKVIYGSKTRAFHRNGLQNLAAVAISFEKFTTPSLKNFTLGEGATAAVNMFDMEAAAKGHRTLSSVALSDLDVQID